MSRRHRYFPDDNATNEWINSVKESARSTYKSAWRHFLDFTAMTGDQILENRKTDTQQFWEKKVLEFKQWFAQQKKPNGEMYGEGTARTAASGVVRSFFAYHRYSLRLRRTESTKLTEARRKYEDYKFSRDDLKKMADHGNLEEQYVVVAGKSFGLRAGDFLALTRGQLEPYINRPVPICIGPLITEKEKVEAYPFIDSDAQPVIKLLLEKMTREGRTDPNQRMLTYKDPIELTRVLKRLARRAGVNVGSKKVRFHCLRKFLTDRLKNFMSESAWKQIVGKKITESAYVSEEGLRDDYARAMSETTFTKAAEGDIELLAKKQALIMLAKLQGMKEEEMEKIFRERRATTLREQVIILEDATTKRKTRINGGCSDGVHCGEKFEQVSENDLLRYLRDGWQVAYKLANEKVIVKRQRL